MKITIAESLGTRNQISDNSSMQKVIMIVNDGWQIMRDLTYNFHTKSTILHYYIIPCMIMNVVCI